MYSFNDLAVACATIYFFPFEVKMLHCKGKVPEVKC